MYHNVFLPERYTGDKRGLNQVPVSNYYFITSRYLDERARFDSAAWDEAINKGSLRKEDFLNTVESASQLVTFTFGAQTVHYKCKRMLLYVLLIMNFLSLMIFGVTFGAAYGVCAVMTLVFLIYESCLVSRQRNNAKDACEEMFKFVEAENNSRYR
jgi:hypothetical protein